MDDRIINLSKSIDRINKKENKIMFFLPSVPQASGGIGVVYEHIKILVDLGYDAHIIWDDSDNQKYHKPEWLGEEYTSLKHIGLSTKPVVSPEDLIIIPEGCTPFLEQLNKNNVPCMRVILCQSYLYILGSLMPGMSWLNFNIKDVIVVTPTLQSYVERIFGKDKFNFKLIRPSINEKIFKPTKKPKMPLIAISSRDQQNTLNIIKHFYAAFPQYRFITFKDMQGLTREEFAENLQEACLGVWVDQIAGFGTFPIECAKTDTPFIALVPNIIPEYASDDKGGAWVQNILNIPDTIAAFLNYWFEDRVPEQITNGSKELAQMYSKSEEEKNIELVYSEYIGKRKQEIQTVIDKIKSEENEILTPEIEVLN